MYVVLREFLLSMEPKTVSVFLNPFKYYDIEFIIVVFSYSLCHHFSLLTFHRLRQDGTVWRWEGASTLATEVPDDTSVAALSLGPAPIGPKSAAGPRSSTSAATVCPCSTEHDPAPRVGRSPDPGATHHHPADHRPAYYWGQPHGAAPYDQPSPAAPQPGQPHTDHQFTNATADTASDTATGKVPWEN